MSVLWIVAAALVIAGCVVLRARQIVRDRRDEAWADDWISQLRAMRGAASWPAGDDDLDDRAAQVEALTAGELEQRRLEKAIARHPAGGTQS